MILVLQRGNVGYYGGRALRQGWARGQALRLGWARGPSAAARMGEGAEIFLHEEVATWEVATLENTLRKLPLGKVPNIYTTPTPNISCSRNKDINTPSCIYDILYYSYIVYL